MINRKRKGDGFAREVAAAFGEALGVWAERGYQFRGGHEAPDCDVPGFWVECKRAKKSAPRAALKQAAKDAPAGRVPIAVLKNDRAPAIAVLHLDDLLAILRGGRVQTSASTAAGVPMSPAEVVERMGRLIPGGGIEPSAPALAEKMEKKVGKAKREREIIATIRQPAPWSLSLRSDELSKEVLAALVAPPAAAPRRRSSKRRR